MQAQELLRNPLLRESFHAMRTDLNAQMAVVSLSHMDAKETAYRLVMAFQMAGAIERYLTDVIETGHAAADALSLRGTRLD